MINFLKNKQKIDWLKLNELAKLEEIEKYSSQKPVVIFKHSTRCSISSVVISRLERNWKSEEMNDIKMYYLDLINHREISDQIVKTFNIQHQSPQILVIKNGKCIYNASHTFISYEQIKKYTLN